MAAPMRSGCQERCSLISTGRVAPAGMWTMKWEVASSGSKPKVPARISEGSVMKLLATKERTERKEVEEKRGQTLSERAWAAVGQDVFLDLEFVGAEVD